MTHEEAFYCRLMLSVGILDEYDNYIIKVLEEEKPLSDVVLGLSFCTSDRNETLAILSE